MRCVACDSVIDEVFIKVSGQDELCEDCLATVQKAVLPFWGAMEAEDEREIVEEEQEMVIK